MDAAEIAKPTHPTDLMGVALGRGLINARVSDTPNYIGAGFAQTQPAPHPQRPLARVEVLAVLKAHLAISMARPPKMNEQDALRALITVFERME